MLATSTVHRSPSKPGWQTDELEEEWVEPSLDSHDNNEDHINPSEIHSLSVISNDRFGDVAPPSPILSRYGTLTSPTPPGTFLIREDQLAAPILPKPLVPGKRKGLLKDFFSPLALETMFEPPSPHLIEDNLPAVTSQLSQLHVAEVGINDLLNQEEDLRLSGKAADGGLGEVDMEEETRETRSFPMVEHDKANNHPENDPESDPEEDESEDVILASDIPNLISFDGRKPSSAYKFTFSAARPNSLPSTIPERTSPCFNQIQNIPSSQPPAPATDPRLRLFQFQYDTFTRDHLSAMVDSIAVHTPSSNSSKSKIPVNVLSRVHSRDQIFSTPEQPDTYLRATKRLKLTPPEDLTQDDIPLEPRLRKDYVGESKQFMQKIKQARTASIMTIVSLKENIQATNVEDQSTVQDRPRRAPLGDVRSMWSSDTPSESSGSGHERSNQSPTPSSTLLPSDAHASTSLRPVYPISTLTPSIPSSLFSSTSNSTASKPPSITSALGYRRQAADLMAQIRKDMTTGKRLVSLETVKDRTMNEENNPEAGDLLQVYVAPASPPRVHVGSSWTPPSGPQSVTSQRSESQVDEMEKPLAPRKILKPSPRKLLRRLSAADEVDRELAMDKSNSDISFRVLVPQKEPDARLGERLDAKYFPEVTLSPKSASHPLSNLHPQPQSVQVFHVSAPAPSLAVPEILHPPAPSTGSEPNRIVSGGTSSSVETADSVLTRGTSATSSTSVITGRTASTGSVASAASFVKHAGPAQMTRIGPEDVPTLPEMVGGMRFDRELMRWIKAGPTKEGRVVNEEDGLPVLSEESDDPFRSFESLESGRVDGGGDVEVADATAGNDANAQSIEEAEEEQEPQVPVPGNLVTTIMHGDDTDDSFEFDSESGAAVVEVMTGVYSHDTDTDTETTDSEGNDHQAEIQADMIDNPYQEIEAAEDVTVTIPAQQAVVAIAKYPLVAPESYSTPIPPHRTNVPPPRSALKNGSSLLNQKSPGVAMRTPNNVFNSAHRRSVSFSDGRKDGKIKGLGRNTGEETSVEGPSPILPVLASASTTPFVPSARGNRIAAILEDLAEPSFEDQTPSKASTSSRPPTGAIQSLVSRSQPESAMKSSRRPFTRSVKEKELSLAQGNQTFLTECSFGIAHDKLLQVITDVHPYVPYWESLEQIDLSKRGVDSVARLKEFLPQLDALKLDTNSLSWLTGVPRTVRTLSVASNFLTALTSFNHLLNLENLDISNNQIDSLQQLSCLRHLRELKADGNAITSLDGLGELDGLTKLSLKNNCITHVDFGELRWSRMELLNLSQNRLRGITGLSSLSSLCAMNLDHNYIVSLEADGPMPRLRTLRVSDNRLTRLDASRFTNVRTLYADNNRLPYLHGAQRLRRLENLSLRNQGGKGLTLATNDIRDVKRLYLSGNPLSSSFFDEPCYNLIYLELAACKLTELPQDLVRLIPNVRVLNLNYNFLTDARALDGLTRLRKLTLIGSRLKGTKSLVRMLRRMVDIEMLDFRMNPCTLGWYLPILVQDVPGALQPSEDTRSGPEEKTHSAMDGRAGTGVGGGGCAASHYRWQELDAKFRRDLPDEAYVGRLAYRGLVMRACPRVRMLDGVLVEGREREKAERLLQGVLCAKAEA